MVSKKNNRCTKTNKNYGFAELIEQNCEKGSGKKTPKEYRNG